MGSLTQEDPLGLAGGLNLYGFAKGDPVNFSDPFGLCKIDVRANRVLKSKYRHTYIVATEPDATQTVFRGGPSRINADAATRERMREKGEPSEGGLFGPIATTEAPYHKGSVDWNSNAPSTRLVDNDEPCDRYKKMFRGTMNKIESAQIPYRVFGTNSNSATFTVLLGAGIKPPDFVGNIDLDEDAPGWRIQLVIP